MASGYRIEFSALGGQEKKMRREGVTDSKRVSQLRFE